MDTIFDFSLFSSSPLYFFILSVIPWAAESVKRERKLDPACVFCDEVPHAGTLACLHTDLKMK